MRMYRTTNYPDAVSQQMSQTTTSDDEVQTAHCTSDDRKRSGNTILPDGGIEKTDDGEVIVPDEVYNQLEATRESGAVNMFSEIEHGLREFGFDAALEWVQNNRGAYTEGFSNGFAPESEVEDDE